MAQSCAAVLAFFRSCTAHSPETSPSLPSKRLRVWRRVVLPYWPFFVLAPPILRRHRRPSRQSACAYGAELCCRIGLFSFLHRPFSGDIAVPPVKALARMAQSCAAVLAFFRSCTAHSPETSPSLP